MSGTAHIISLHLCDNKLVVTSDQLSSWGKTAPVAIVPDSMSYGEFTHWVLGATILVYDQTSELLDYAETHGLCIDSEQIIDFADDPHFELFMRKRSLPTHLVLYQFSNASCPISDRGKEGYSAEGSNGGDMVWNINEVAEFLGISERSVRELVANKEIPFKKVGGMLRFLKSTIVDWLRAG